MFYVVQPLYVNAKPKVFFASKAANGIGTKDHMALTFARSVELKRPTSAKPSKNSKQGKVKGAS